MTLRENVRFRGRARNLPFVFVYIVLFLVAVFSCRIADTGAVCISPDTTAPSILSAYLDRSYYTREKEARVIALVAIVDSEGMRIRVKAEGAAGIEGESAVAGGRAVVPVPISALEPGEYELSVELVDSGGRQAAGHSSALRLLKRHPAAEGSEVKIDHENIAALVDGEPFFPIGFISLPVEKMGVMAGAGFNTCFMWSLREVGGEAGIHAEREYMDAAHAAGLRIVNEPVARGSDGHPRYADPLFREKMGNLTAEEVPALVKAVKNHPALLAWYGMDEPNLAPPLMKGEGKSIIELADDLYRAIKEAGPYHPVYELFCVRIPTDPGWEKTYDIAGVDTYWCPLRGESPSYVSHWTERAVEIADRGRIPMWLILQATVWSRSGRPLSPGEQRAQTYLGLVSGARGIIYFTAPHGGQYEPTWEEIKQLASEMNHLSPILLTQPLPQEVRGDRETIHVLARQYRDKLYLLAVNASPAPVKAGFRLPGMPSGRAEVLFEGRRVPVASGAFSDRFKGYASRVYEIPVASLNLPEPFVIQVEAEEEAPPRAREAARSAELIVAPEDNLAADPGFEDGSGWTFSDWDRKYSDAEGVFDEHEAFSGSRSARITRAHTESAAQFVSAPVRLKADAMYRFGGRIRADISEGLRGPSIFLADPDLEMIGPRIELPGRTVSNPSGRTGWRQYSAVFGTGSRPVTVRVYCRLGNSVGTAWFDDIFLTEIPAGEALNLLKNSSFEYGIPGWPDFWVPMAHRKAWWAAAGARESGWGTVDSVSFHGSQSMRIRREGPEEDDGYRIGARASRTAAARVSGGNPYTFSIYLKGDRPGMKVRMFILGGERYNYRDVEITDSWERYALTWEIPPETSSARVRFDLMSPGILLADAAQLEAGVEAAQYVSDGYRHMY